MDFALASRLNQNTKLALVGAGGKTGALFQLARDFLTKDASPKASVLITTSVYFSTSQVKQADHHFIINKDQDTKIFERSIPSGIVLITGPLQQKNYQIDRLKGLEHNSLNRLHELAKFHQIPLLIKADGSRMLPLKAPNEHEPVIPEFCNIVIVVAGLSGLSKPINDQWVHRPQQFAKLSSLKINQPVTPNTLCKVLLHPLGGLKNIPTHARRIVLLHQATTPDLQASAQSIAQPLLTEYHAVIIADLSENIIGDSQTNHQDVPKRKIFAVHEQIAGIILAAGGSSRFGQPKQLLEWKGMPFIQHVVKTALDAGLSPVIVVTGNASDLVIPTLANWNVKCVHNPNWQEGQSTSLKIGITALPEHIGGALFLLVDQPQIPSDLVSALIESHAKTLSPITLPQIDGQRGNPVLFDRATFSHLMTLQGDMGGRALFAKYPLIWLIWHDSNMLLDIDTPENYQRLQQLG